MNKLSQLIAFQFLLTSLIYTGVNQHNTNQKSWIIEQGLLNNFRKIDDDNVITKFFEFDKDKNVYILKADFEPIYPTNKKFNNYIGLVSEHSKNPRRHILLEFNCCKVLNQCATKAYFATFENPAFARCVCITDNPTQWNNQICLSAKKKSDLYMRKFATN